MTECVEARRPRSPGPSLPTPRHHATLTGAARRAVHMASRDVPSASTRHRRTTNGHLTVSTHTGCPHLDGFDPWAAEPFPALAAARRDSPVFFSPVLGAYVVTTHAEARHIFSNPLVFRVSGTHGRSVEPPPELVAEVGPEYHFLIGGGTLTDSDPPEHTRLRKAMQEHFKMRQVGALEPFMRELATDLVDRFVSDGRVELYKQFTGRFGAGVIAALLGVPDDRDRFSVWAEAKVRLSEGNTGVDPGAERPRLFRELIEYDDFVRDLVARRRADPGDDLVSSFIQARTPDGAPAMSDAELLANVSSMVSAGTDTSATLVARVVYLLLLTGQWDIVQDDRALIPRAVEETMRFIGPVHGVPRWAAEDVELCGVSIPSGSQLYVVIASANRDEEIFPEADRFDVLRDDKTRHLGFGQATHFCLGAPLARAEARIAMEVLMDRIPRPRLVGAEKSYAAVPGLILPVVEHLNLEWDVAVPA